MKPLVRSFSSRLAATVGVGWVCTCAAISHASESLRSDYRTTAPTFTAYFENDTVAKTDRHYTNGVKLSWLSADLNSWGQEGWRKTFLEALPFVNRPDAQRKFGFALGQNIYTPQEIELVPPDPNDRPYAGWSYIELKFASKSATVMNAISVQIGVVGPHSYAEDVQRIVHEWLDNKRPLGWDYQLRDELGINVVFERKGRLFIHTPGNLLGADLVPHIGVSLGNVQTHANAGASLRAGFNLQNDFGVDLIRAGGGPSGFGENGFGKLSFFVFGGVDGRAILRDIFLDGNTFKDSPSVEKEAFVADLYYGAGVVAGHWQLTYTQVVRTREFETQDADNIFGSLSLTYAW
jgi:lipid A 3-O-deacylase